MLVGLSGGIGSGKSTVAAALAARGAVVVDVDAIAREVLEPGTDGFAEVVERFGPEVVGDDGRLDRVALARIVFSDPEARKALEGIVHPRVLEESARRTGAAPAGAVVVVDVPLLVEAAAQGYDLVMMVEAPEDVRLDRLAGRGVDRDDARRRMAAQASDAQRRAVADIVIDNSGTVADLDAQVDAAWREIERRRDSPA